MDFQKSIFKAGEVIRKNSPSILVGVGVAGVLTTTILAVKATPKALSILEDDIVERDEPHTFMDKVKLTWKCYVPSAIMGTVTITAIISANTINLKRSAAIAGLYSVTEATLQEYQAKVVEQLGVSKEQKIRDAVVQDRLDKIDSDNIFILGTGEHLMYDSLSGRYFKGDIEMVRKSVNDINQRLINEMWIDLNSLYDILGLPGTSMGDEIGWNVDHMLAISFDGGLTDKGEPCVVLNYDVSPRHDFRI